MSKNIKCFFKAQKNSQVNSKVLLFIAGMNQASQGCKMCITFKTVFGTGGISQLWCFAC